MTAAQDEDAVPDNIITLTHAASGGGYGLVTAELPVTIAEKDMKRVTISPTTLNISEGNSVDYTVVLGTQPSADVTVTVSGHSGTDASLSGATLTSDALTFTTTNWNTAQTVTVSAAEDDDSLHEDPVTLTHAVAGGDYDGLSAPSVSVAIYDNDPVIPPTPINSFTKEIPVSPVPGGDNHQPAGTDHPRGPERHLRDHPRRPALLHGDRHRQSTAGDGPHRQPGVHGLHHRQLGHHPDRHRLHQ